MATTPTQNYRWLIPTPGTENDTWGPILNTVLAQIDAEMANKVDLPGVTRTFRSYGATGDGVTNDTAFIQSAVDDAHTNGYTLAGEGKTYAVAGNIVLPATGRIEDATFLQTTPGAATQTLRRIDLTFLSGPWTLKRVKVDRGTDITAGVFTDGPLGINFTGVTLGLTLEDVEVTGDGKGTGILFLNCRNVRVDGMWIHDMTWQSADTPQGEQMQGIRVQDCDDVQVRDFVIENLLVDVVAMPPSSSPLIYSPNMQSDGIVVGDSRDVAFIDGVVRQVGEGIDVAGTDPQGQNWTERLWMINVKMEDIYAYGQKWAYKTLDCGVINCQSLRCGIAGFMVSGSGFPLDSAANNIKFTSCNAIDTGSNRKWAGGRAGFQFMQGALTLSQTNTMVSNCAAIDRQSYIQQVSITIASPAVITHRNHGLVVDSQIIFLTTGRLPSGITRGTRYYVKTVTDENTYTIAATSGGAAINTSTLGFTVTIASPAVFTAIGHALTVNAPVSFTTTGALPTGLSPGTTYFVATVPSADTFTVSATVGGAEINTSGSQSGVHTLTQSGKQTVSPYTTISIASPAVITQTVKRFVNDAVVFYAATSLGGALPPEIVEGTTYYVLTTPTDTTFTISATEGGAAINTSGSVTQPVTTSMNTMKHGFYTEADNTIYLVGTVVEGATHEDYKEN